MVATPRNALVKEIFKVVPPRPPVVPPTPPATSDKVKFNFKKAGGKQQCNSCVLFRFRFPPAVSAPVAVCETLKINVRLVYLGSPVKKTRPSQPTPQVVDGKKYACEQCGFSTDLMGVLMSHRKQHLTSASASTPEKNVKSVVPKPKPPAVEKSPPKLKPQAPVKKAPAPRVSFKTHLKCS
jgi:hypothetical protein